MATNRRAEQFRILGRSSGPCGRCESAETDGARLLGAVPVIGRTAGCGREARARATRVLIEREIVELRTATVLPVPIPRPCKSCGMFVFMHDSVEMIRSADGEVAILFETGRNDNCTGRPPSRAGGTVAYAASRPVPVSASVHRDVNVPADRAGATVRTAGGRRRLSGYPTEQPSPQSGLTTSVTGTATPVPYRSQNAA